MGYIVDNTWHEVSEVRKTPDSIDWLMLIAIYIVTVCQAVDYDRVIGIIWRVVDCGRC